MRPPLQSPESMDMKKKAKVIVNKMLANIYDICTTIYLCSPLNRTLCLLLTLHPTSLILNKN